MKRGGVSWGRLWWCTPSGGKLLHLQDMTNVTWSHLGLVLIIVSHVTVLHWHTHSGYYRSYPESWNLPLVNSFCQYCVGAHSIMWYIIFSFLFLCHSFYCRRYSIHVINKPLSQVLLLADLCYGGRTGRHRPCQVQSQCGGVPWLQPEGCCV